MPLPQKMSQADLQKYLDDAKVSLGNKYNPDELIQDLSNQDVQIEGLNEPPKKQGFFSRLKDSVLSTPERLQRGFGSTDVREGRQETSKGFDLADLPGDIADIIGPALPVAGSIGGGIIGAGAGIPTGPGAIATGVAGAATGAGVLETGRRAVGNLLNVEERFADRRKTPLEDIKGIATEAAIGGAGELIGGQLIARPLAAIGGRVLRPFVRHFNDDLARIAAREGVDMPVSAVSDSPIVELGEAAGSKGFFGGKLAQQVDKAKSQLDNAANKFVENLKGSDDLIQAGKSINEGLEEYRSAWMKGKTNLYKKATENLDEQAIISKFGQLYPDTSNTVSLLDNLISDDQLAREVLGEGFDVSVLKTLRNNLAEGKSFDSINAALSKLSKMAQFGSRDNVVTGDPAVIRKVAATLDDDIMKWLQKVNPEAYESAVRADEAFKAGIQGLNSTTGKVIGSLSDEPSRVVNRVIKPKSPEQASRVLELIISTEGGADRVANVQSAFTRKLLDEAVGNSDSLAGKSLNRVLNKYGDETVDAVLGQDARILLREYAQIAEGIGKSQAITGGSQTAFLTKLNALVLSIATGRIELAAGIVGGDAALTTLFNTEIGKRLLTEGLTAPTVFEKFGVPASKFLGREAADQFSQ